MRHVVAWTLYPGVLVGSVVAGWGLLAAGWPPGWAVGLVIVAASVPILVAQRFLPYEPRWRAAPAVFGVDLIHMGLTGLTGEAIRAGMVGVLVWGGTEAAGWLGGGMWPTSWPIVAQLPIALLVGDLGAYVAHRLAHEVPILWRVHAMHHTSRRMYVFAASRNHPMNVALTWLFQVGPLVVLGAGGEVLALVALFTSVHGLLQHANVDLRHGLLNRVFATAEVHRWHHHPDADISNHNYGSNLVIWDRLFGSYLLPDDAPRDAGLADLEIPDNLLAHLWSPFNLYRYLVRE